MLCSMSHDFFVLAPVGILMFLFEKSQKYKLLESTYTLVTGII